jgi:hypothetical protein
MRIRHASLRSGGEPGNDSCFQHLVPITFQIEPPSNNRASGMHRKRSIEVGQQRCVWGADVARHILKRDDEAGEERARCKRGRNKVPKPRLRIVRKIKGEVDGAEQRECGREDGSVDT